MERAVALLFGLGLSISVSHSAVHWDLVTDFKTTADHLAVVEGDGKFVAVGPKLLIASSDKGATWRPVDQSPLGTLNSVAFGNHTFVAVGSGNQIYSSTNGLNWVSTLSPVPKTFTRIVAGDGQFVAVAPGVIASSPDGRVWTSQANANISGTTLAYGNGKFLIAENTSGDFYGSTTFTLWSSSDGLNWTSSLFSYPSGPSDYVYGGCPGNCPKTFKPVSVAFGAGKFALLASNGRMALYMGAMAYILTSIDGQTWSWAVEGGLSCFPVSSPAPGQLSFVNGFFAYNEFFPTLRYSTDLMSWNSTTFPQFQQGISEAYLDGTYVTVGYGGFRAVGPNLSSWTATSPTTGGSELSAIAFAGDTGVAIGADQALKVTTNRSAAFSPATLPENAGQLKAIRFADGKFIAVGAGGTIIRSTDGVAWTKRLSNTTADLNDVTFGGGRSGQWVAVGNSGTIVTSSSGATFSLTASGTQVPLRGVTYGGGQFVAVGNDGAFLRSPNGQTWTGDGTEEAVTLHSVAYGNGRFVAVGVNGMTHVSTNGSNWAAHPKAGITTFTRVSFAHGIFAAVEGDTSTVYTSIDGVSWDAQTLSSPLKGVNESDGDLWLTGPADSVWKAAVSQSAIRLSASIRPDLHLELTIEAPASGNYEIFSTSDATSQNWTSRGVQNFAEGTSTWIDDQPMSGSRFYRVRKQ